MGVALTDPEAREIVYGMPYKAWQALHQREATPAQAAAFRGAERGELARRRNDTATSRKPGERRGVASLR